MNNQRLIIVLPSSFRLESTYAAAEPEIAVFTAMRLETDALSKLLARKGKDSMYWSEEANHSLHVLLKSSSGTHHLVLPPRAYAQNETARAAENLLSLYPTINKLIFIGVGGGFPQAKRGDIVISDEIANISLKWVMPGGKTRPKPLPKPASEVLFKQAEDIRDRMKREPSWWERTRDEAYKTLEYQHGKIVLQQIKIGNIREQPEPLGRTDCVL